MTDNIENIHDYDSIIEYCPESPEGQKDSYFNDPDIQDCEPPPRIVFVCVLCYRHYDLKEDLRGHMIEYHKYIPIVDVKPTEESKVLLEKRQQNEIKEEIEEEFISITSSEANVDEPKKFREIKPVPFKNFRLILREKMYLKCPAVPGCVYKFETEEQRRNHLKCHLKGSAQFKCYLCSTAMNNWRKCTAHLWKIHKMDVDLLKCPECEFKSHASG